MLPISEKFVWHHIYFWREVASIYNVKKHCDNSLWFCWPEHYWNWNFWTHTFGKNVAFFDKICIWKSLTQKHDRQAWNTWGSIYLLPCIHSKQLINRYSVCVIYDVFKQIHNVYTNSFIYDLFLHLRIKK